MSARKILVFALAIAMCVGLFSACATHQETPNTTPLSTEPLSDGDKYYIAMSTALTGAVAEVGILGQYSAQMAIDEINAAGGINGRQLELVAYDDKVDVAESTLVAQRIVEDGRFIVAFAPLFSSCVLASLPIYEKGGVPVFASTANNVEIKGENFLRMVLPSTVQAPQVAACAVNNYGLKKIAIIYTMSDFGTAMLDGITDVVTRLGSDVVVSESYVAGTDKDFSVHLSKVQKAGVDGVIIVGDYNEASMIIVQADRAGGFENVKFISDSHVISDFFLERIKDVSILDNIALACAYNPFDDRQVFSDFENKFKEKFNASTSEPVVYHYDMVYIVAKALAAGATKDTLVATIKGMEFTDLLSASGTIKFDKDGNRNYTDIAIIGVKDGKFYSTGEYVDMTNAIQ